MADLTRLGPSLVGTVNHWAVHDMSPVVSEIIDDRASDLKTFNKYIGVKMKWSLFVSTIGWRVVVFVVFPADNISVLSSSDIGQPVLNSGKNFTKISLQQHQSVTDLVFGG